MDGENEAESDLSSSSKQTPYGKPRKKSLRQRCKELFQDSFEFSKIILEPDQLAVPISDDLKYLEILPYRKNFSHIWNPLSLNFKQKSAENLYKTSLYKFISARLVLFGSLFMITSIIGVSIAYIIEKAQTTYTTYFFITGAILPVSLILTSLSTFLRSYVEWVYSVFCVTFSVSWFINNYLHIRSDKSNDDEYFKQAALTGQILILFILIPIPLIGISWLYALISLLITFIIYLIGDILFYKQLQHENVTYILIFSILSQLLYSTLILSLSYQKEKSLRSEFYNLLRIKKLEDTRKKQSYPDLNEDYFDKTSIRSFNQIEINQMIDAMIGLDQKCNTLGHRSATWRYEINKLRNASPNRFEMSPQNSQLSNLDINILSSNAEKFFDIMDQGLNRNGEAIEEFDPLNFSEFLDFENKIDNRWGQFWDLDLINSSDKNPIVNAGISLLTNLISHPKIASETSEVDNRMICQTTTLVKFLINLQNAYLKNPYHNKTHAAEVAHLASCLTSMQEIRDKRHSGFNFLNKNSKISLLTGPMGEFAFVIAALAHDVGHPGRTNQFLINTNSTLAMVYNDCSVLENYHASKLFSITSMKSSEIFSYLNDKCYLEMRKRIIEMILVTDMSKHFEEITIFKQTLQSNHFNPCDEVNDGWLLVKICLKAGDIGHGALVWDQHRMWSQRVLDEFYSQGDEEESRGLDKSPLCERLNPINLAKSQIGFLQFLVKPVFIELSKSCPTDKIESQCIVKINHNIDLWKNEITENNKVDFLL